MFIPKLYFKYGAMGSSKTANALMCKYNYEEKGFRTILLKPALDDRSGLETVKSRIGLESKAIVIGSDVDIVELTCLMDKDVIIVDECQLLTEKQIEELFEISFNVPVLCYGLLTDFQAKLFPASKRLVELADSLNEIKSVCRCGKKANRNARIEDGKIIKVGEQILIGGNESYVGLCKECYKKGII